MIATSRDGDVWRLVDGLVPVGDVTLLAAAESGGLAVAVGSDVEYESHPTLGLQGTSRGAVVRKPTGGSWSAITTPDALVGGDLRGVLGVDGGFVAFGGYAAETVGLGCSWGCLDGAGIWYSQEGSTWTAALLVEPMEGVYMWFGGIAKHEGRLLAYAATYADDTSSTDLWTSSDGRTWMSVDPTGLSGVALQSVVAVADGFIGVTDRDAEIPGPTVYRSDDGQTWQAVTPVAPSLSGIAAVDGGFVAWDNIIMNDSYGVWTSVDALVWTQQDAYVPFYAGGMVSDGRTVVSIGSNTGVDPVWVGTLTPRA